MQNHQPVLVDQVISLLQPKAGEVFIDMTSGYGGHSEKLLKKVGTKGLGYLVDRDPKSINYLKDKFFDKTNIKVIYTSYADVEKFIDGNVDMILMDLGVSSKQLDQADRGFSFNKDARLDMRMDINQKLDAYYVINNYSYKDLQRIIGEYGEESKSRKIAKAIVESRRVKTIDTTLELANIIRKIARSNWRIDPCTKTFQAIRIEVNDELNQLKKGLQATIRLLKPGGRLAVISFHSLEDRIVKHFINENSKEETDITGQVVKAKIFEKVTKKPVSGEKELNFNRRARSAKLRVAVKIK